MKALDTAKDSMLQEDLRQYGGKTKTYKILLKQKKLDYVAKEGTRVAEQDLEEAEEPYRL